MNDLDKIARDVAEKVYPLDIYYDDNGYKQDYNESRREGYVDGFKSGYNYPKWVSFVERLPENNQIVDLFVDGQRLTNYRKVEGDDYFTPLHGGISCVRYDNTKYYSNATHWMPLPPTPTK